MKSELRSVVDRNFWTKQSPEHDEVVTHNEWVPVIEKDVAFALIITWEAVDGSDEVTEVTGSCKTELEILPRSGKVLVFREVEAIYSRQVAPEISVRQTKAGVREDVRWKVISGDECGSSVLNCPSWEPGSTHI